MSPAKHPLVEAAPDTLRLFCPAKLNLALSVGPPQPDGLHPIASWMVPIDFGDTLTLRRCRAPTKPCIAYAEDAPRPSKIDWPTEHDLAVRAWHALEAHLGQPLHVELSLDKRVPTGAGLGGGSADAAAVLDGLNRLFELSLSEQELLALAATLGADVVFQLGARRQPTGAVVSGIGETLEPLPPRPPCPVCVVLPAFGCPTGDVYRAFDRSAGHQPDRLDLKAVRDLAAQPLDSAAPLWNNLAQPAMMVRPELKRIRDMIAVSGHTPHVTGSGSALFVIPADPAPHALERTRKQLATTTGCPVVLTTTAG